MRIIRKFLKALSFNSREIHFNIDNKWFKSTFSFTFYRKVRQVVNWRISYELKAIPIKVGLDFEMNDLWLASVNASKLNDLFPFLW